MTIEVIVIWTMIVFLALGDVGTTTKPGGIGKSNYGKISRMTTTMTKVREKLHKWMMIQNLSMATS